MEIVLRSGGGGGERNREEPTVKERPILFSAPMVRAILAGRKTQTRRAVELRDGESVVTSDRWLVTTAKRAIRCRYGQPGDRLWVKEAWQLVGNGPRYRATNPGDKTVRTVWKTPIFMPRWASRITLEVTAVLAEHVQDISREDAIAEGIDCLGNPVIAYRALWDSINAKRHTWKSNPWIWAITFKVIGGKEALRDYLE